MALGTDGKHQYAKGSEGQRECGVIHQEVIDPERLQRTLTGCGGAAKQMAVKCVNAVRHGYVGQPR